MSAEFWPNTEIPVIMSSHVEHGAHLHREATPGPWTAHDLGDRYEIRDTDGNLVAETWHRENAELIAEARGLIPAFVAQVHGPAALKSHEERAEAGQKYLEEAREQLAASAVDVPEPIGDWDPWDDDDEDDELETAERERDIAWATLAAIVAALGLTNAAASELPERVRGLRDEIEALQARLGVARAEVTRLDDVEAIGHATLCDEQERTERLTAERDEAHAAGVAEERARVVAWLERWRASIDIRRHLDAHLALAHASDFIERGVDEVTEPERVARELAENIERGESEVAHGGRVNDDGKAIPWTLQVRDVAGLGHVEVLVVAPDAAGMRAAMQGYQAATFTRRLGANVLFHEGGGRVRFAHATGYQMQVAGTRPALVVILGGASGPVVEEARRRALFSGATVRVEVVRG